MQFNIIYLCLLICNTVKAAWASQTNVDKVLKKIELANLKRCWFLLSWASQRLWLPHKTWVATNQGILNDSHALAFHPPILPIVRIIIMSLHISTSPHNLCCSPPQRPKACQMPHVVWFWGRSHFMHTLNFGRILHCRRIGHPKRVVISRARTPNQLVNSQRWLVDVHWAF